MLMCPYTDGTASITAALAAAARSGVLRYLRQPLTVAITAAPWLHQPCSGYLCTADNARFASCFADWLAASEFN